MKTQSVLYSLYRSHVGLAPSDLPLAMQDIGIKRSFKIGSLLWNLVNFQVYVMVKVARVTSIQRIVLTN